MLLAAAAAAAVLACCGCRGGRKYRRSRGSLSRPASQLAQQASLQAEPTGLASRHTVYLDSLDALDSSNPLSKSVWAQESNQLVCFAC